MKNTPEWGVQTGTRKKENSPCVGDSLKSLEFAGNVTAATGDLLGEVALQQAFEGFSMSGLVLGHFIKTCATLGFAYNFSTSLKPSPAIHLSNASGKVYWRCRHTTFSTDHFGVF